MSRYINRDSKEYKDILYAVGGRELIADLITLSEVAGIGIPLGAIVSSWGDVSRQIDLNNQEGVDFRTKRDKYGNIIKNTGEGL